MCKKIVLSAFIFATCMSACTPPKSEKPVLYPNQQLQSGGNMKAHAAQQYCMALADEYVHEPDRYQEAMKTGVKGAVLGTATGALGATIMNNSAGRGAGAGAAIGGILGVVKSLQETNEHSPSYQRFVERCLQKQGYEVIGWSVQDTSRAMTPLM
jgi:hypothetical protein